MFRNSQMLTLLCVFPHIVVNVDVEQFSTIRTPDFPLERYEVEVLPARTGPPDTVNRIEVCLTLLPVHIFFVVNHFRKPSVGVEPTTFPVYKTGALPIVR